MRDGQSSFILLQPKNGRRRFWIGSYRFTMFWVRHKLLIFFDHIQRWGYRFWGEPYRFAGLPLFIKKRLHMFWPLYRNTIFPMLGCSSWLHFCSFQLSLIIAHHHPIPSPRRRRIASRGLQDHSAPQGNCSSSISWSWALTLRWPRNCLVIRQVNFGGILPCRLRRHAGFVLK